MEIVATTPGMSGLPLDFSHYYTDDDTAVQRRRKDMQAVMEFNIGTLQGIVFPFTPITSLYAGDDPDVVAMQSAGSALTAWLTVTALGGAEAGALTVGRSVSSRAVLSTVAPALPALASVAAADKYISHMEQYEPDGNVHDKSSFWSSIGAAMAGTFGGMPSVGDY